ncbi:MAG: hypothetical protein JXL80_15125 [Planctomycetes bacterium]|nr:hypothetical protein [Planctomycetota bacterium]
MACLTKTIVSLLVVVSVSGCAGSGSLAPSDQELGIRQEDGSRDVPFYAFYSWASDLADNPVRFKQLAETGIRMIGSPLRENQEKGIMQCAEHGIQVAGILNFNGFGRKMDLDGFRDYVSKAVRRYGPEGSLWTEGRPFKYRLKVPGDRVVLYNRELLGGVVYSKESGSISDEGEIKIPVSGLPLLVSTAVTPEQEEATKLYLAAPTPGQWKPIRGAED